MTRLLCLFFISILCFDVSSQSDKIIFQARNQLRHPLKKISQIQLVQNRFFSVVQQNYESNNATRNDLIEFDRNGVMVANVRFKKDASDNKVDLVGITTNQSKLFGFYEVIDGDRSILYKSEFDLKTFELSEEKEQIFRGEKSQIINSPLIDLNPKLDINDNYFEKRLYAMVEFEAEEKYLVMRRDPGKNTDVPRIQIKLYDTNQKLLVDGRLQIQGSNKRTTIEDIEVGSDNRVFFLTSTRDGNAKEFALYIYDPVENDERRILINDKRYIQSLVLDVIGDDAMLGGFCSDKKGSGSWEVVAAPVDFERRTITSLKTLKDYNFDRNDEIEIRNNGDIFYVIATSFRPATQSGSDFQTSQYGNFTQRRTEHTAIYGIDPKGNEKWTHLIPNLINTSTFTFDSYARGYDDIKYDNYGFVEHDDKMSVLFCMNPMNDRKPRKNGSMRLVSARIPKRFGVKRITFGSDGVIDQKIIWENQRNITPLPYFTKRISGDTYFMYASTFRFGDFSFGRLEL